MPDASGETVRSDEELLLAYRDGDRAAFRELFNRYQPLLTRVLARDLATPADVDDLVQQTFLQLHRARLDFRAGNRVRPWLMTIAFNLKRYYFRQRKRRREQPGIEQSHELADPGRDPAAAAEAAQVRAALRLLPDDQRTAISLHWFEGFSFPEIAEIVGAKPSAVKVRAHRGYARLREKLGRDPVTVAGTAAYAKEKPR